MLITCKSMNSIMNDFFAVNKYLDMSKDLDSSNSSVFRILTRNATNLRVLNLSGCSWLNDDSLRSVIRNNTSLDELDLSYCFNCSAAIFQVSIYLYNPEFSFHNKNFRNSNNKMLYTVGLQKYATV